MKVLEIVLFIGVTYKIDTHPFNISIPYFLHYLTSDKKAICYFIFFTTQNT